MSWMPLVAVGMDALKNDQEAELRKKQRIAAIREQLARSYGAPTYGVQAAQANLQERNAPSDGQAMQALLGQLAKRRSSGGM